MYVDTDTRSVVEDRIKDSLTPVFIEVKKHVSVFLDDFQQCSANQMIPFRGCFVSFRTVSYGFSRQQGG